MTRHPAAHRDVTFAITGLTCPDCLVLLLEHTRHLPRVRTVTIDLVAQGESSLTIAPAGAVTPDSVRALVDAIGFHYVSQRRGRRPTHRAGQSNPREDCARPQ